MDAPAEQPAPGPSGVKRPATSDLTQPADKKMRVMQPNEEEHHGRRPEPASGFLQLMSRHISTPIPVVDNQYIVIDTSLMVPYFGSLWTSLIQVIYPDTTYEAANVITEPQFALVCRYLTKARIDTIASAVSGRRVPNRIAIPREMQLPKALADIINGIGPVIVQSGAYQIVPYPETAPAEHAQRLENRVTFAMLQQFSSLVHSASSRNYIRLANISSAIQGTSWWALSPRTSAAPDIVCNNSNSAIVFGTFKEWTPADALLSAIVQRQFDGLIPHVELLNKWTTDFITGIPAIRSSFNLEA